MQSAANMHAALDEVAFVFAHQFYHLLSLALTGDMVGALGAIEVLYCAESVYRFSTDAQTASVSRGQGEIMSQLSRNVRVMRGFGVSRMQVRSVDCTGMADVPGGVLLHVQGKVLGRHGSDPFAEMFALVQQGQQGGEQCFCISHQSFASLRG
jgi:hypothetical protein